MNIAVIGTGYVGLVTGVALSNAGHTVVCVGRKKEKVDQINKGVAPFYEPRLEQLLKKLIKQGVFSASVDFKKSVKESDVIILAVGTPTVNNKIDLTSIKHAAKQVGLVLRNDDTYRLIIVKSTVLPTVTEKVVKPLIEQYSKKKIGAFGLCMNPEFLREGNAVEDATHPDRIVIGQFDDKSGQMAKRVYQSFDCPKVMTNLPTAEMIKYTANALFATMISYSNEIANICEAVGEIDVVDVWKGVHLDSRLSPKTPSGTIRPQLLNYIQSGCGYGGSCFPKDVKALSHLAKELHVTHEMLQSVISTNDDQPTQIIKLLKQAVGDIKDKRIAVLGLSFKPNTDDLRESPSLVVIRLLRKEGAIVVAHDPVVYSKGKRVELESLDIKLSKTSGEALEGADAVLVLTSWDEYKRLTPQIFKKYMNNPVLIDGRRIYNGDIFNMAGVVYKGIGRSKSH